MKPLKTIVFLLILTFVMVSFSQCASTKKLQEKAPLEIGEVYYQNWVAGVKGGGSGVNLYIPVISNLNHIELDSVYFQGKRAKLEAIHPSMVVGRFKSNINQREDIIMSNEPYAEFGNKPPKLEKEIPFELKDNQCVIRYIDGENIKYFKIDDIIKKKIPAFLKTPHHKQY
ncbi:hypothetical protein [Yeosuana sp.]|uniref:hypothetical protein n=1 Tax=Yeosuana sp. TaxID=2529388 RepID=UPI004054F538|tara:strand:+ start:1696 stop:2208 length:513 start_codon:yes stop_codon:yes gene_type:complete